MIIKTQAELREKLIRDMGSDAFIEKMMKAILNNEQPLIAPYEIDNELLGKQSGTTVITAKIRIFAAERPVG